MDKLLDIPVSKIAPNHRQPRTEFDLAALNELAASIREHGVIQPLSVVSINGGYELIAGERRWRASQLAGLEVVPCVVKTKLDDRTLLEVAVIENVQRADLTAADEARAYEQLATEFGLSNDEIAQRVGKSRSTVANLRGLLRLPEGVLERIGSGEGRIPQGTARTLAQIAKIKGATKDIENVARRLAKGDVTTYDAEDMQIDLVRKYALEMATDWDPKWLTTPVQIRDAAGPLEIRDCAGCQYFVKFSGDKYCAEQPVRCYPIKRSLWAQHELERVSKATGIPAATADDRVTPLQVEYQDGPRIKAWLKGKTRPVHLRLMPLIDQPEKQRNGLATHTIRDILKSREVILASSDPSALRKGDDVPVKEPAETPAQKVRREEAEEQARAERREAKGLKRKAQADIDWLGLNAYKAVAPQIVASGVTLEWLAGYVGEHSQVGQWPAMRTSETEVQQALDTARGAERERLLKELIAIRVIGAAVNDSFDPAWHEDWDEAQSRLDLAVTEKPNLDHQSGLGLKLPKGWNHPPVHRTAGNCWHCGQFASTAELTQRDREEGWGVVRHIDELRDVYCPDCQPKKVAKGKAK